MDLNAYDKLVKEEYPEYKRNWRITSLIDSNKFTPFYDKIKPWLDKNCRYHYEWKFNGLIAFENQSDFVVFQVMWDRK